MSCSSRVERSSRVIKPSAPLECAESSVSFRGGSRNESPDYRVRTRCFPQSGAEINLQSLAGINFHIISSKALT